MQRCLQHFLPKSRKVHNDALLRCYSPQMAFLLAAASCCEVYEQQVSEAAVLAAKERPSAPAASAASPSPASASASLSLARSYLNQARAAATGLQTQTALLGGDLAAAGGVGAPDEAKSDVYLLLLVSPQLNPRMPSTQSVEPASARLQAAPGAAAPRVPTG
jgi:hypothetical protein